MGSSALAVLVTSPVGQGGTESQTDNMTKLLLLVLLVPCCFGSRRLRGNANRASQAIRDERSLLGTFPFNQQDAAHGDHGDHHGHHEDHGAHHEPSTAVESGSFRQGDDGVDVSFPAVAAAGPGADGKRCIDKVEMIEEIEYDDVVQCDHSYDRRCHTTYVTQYESQQEEECEENFRKSCFIEYEQIAFNETAEICRTPLVKDCDIQGPEICRTMSSSAPLRLRRSVRTRPLDTPPTPSAPSGPGSSVPLQAVVSSRALRSVTTRSRPLCRTPPRSSVLWSPRGPASM